MEGFVVGIHASKYLNTARRNPLQRHTRSQATDRSSDRSDEIHGPMTHLDCLPTSNGTPITGAWCDPDLVQVQYRPFLLL
jgi:hypothetical protein